MMNAKDIAITGMSCIFPGAYDLDTYWKNILAGKCTIGPVPRDRDIEDALAGTEYSAEPLCTHGGFLPGRIPFPPLEYGIMPSICEDGDPEQLLTLQMADRALKDTGIDPQKEDLTNSEIIIGRGGYLGSFLRQGYQRVDVLPQVVSLVQQLVPGVSPGKLARIRTELKSCFSHLSTDSAPLAIPNISTGRIANRFNMLGANYTVDAACASALVAVDNAVMSLRQDRCDRVITGGIFLASNPSFWWLFARLEAMSSSGMIKPFSKFADGMLAGEGIGILVLERVADAVKAGRRIYAVIKGVGTASDGRGAGLLAPRKEGQLECLRRAYRNADIDPASIELLEGHGTATKIGDHTELEAINDFFGLSTDGVPTRALGSVKSMIGHTMPASGAASLIKMALSLYHKILPPTICEEDGNEGLKKSQFYLNTTARPWVHPPSAKRRAGINAFGFGGINGHAILEEHEENGLNIDDLVMDWPMELFLLAGKSLDDLKSAIKKLIETRKAYLAENKLFGLLSRETCRSGDKFLEYRLAVIAPDYDTLAQRLETALVHLDQSNGQAAIQAEGIYYEPEPLKKDGKIVFVFPGNAFPGLGDDYTQHLAELCLYLPFFRFYFDMLEMNKKLEDKPYRYSTILFTPTKIDHETFVQLKKELRVLDNSASGVFLANTAGNELMTRLGIFPDAVTGTSLGEWSAVVSAGMVRIEQLVSMDANAQGHDIDEITGAIGLTMCPYETVQPHLEAFNRDETTVTCSMDLSPKQVIFAGTREGVDRFCKVLNDAGIWAKYLNLFPIHSPVCKPIADLIYDRLEGLEVSEAKVPVYSAATTEPFPTDSEKMRRLLADNAILPVQMRALFEKLYNDGARIFVQLGGGGKIAAPIDETLEGKPYAIVSLDIANRHPIHQLQDLLATLYAHHTPFNTDILYQHRNAYLDRSIVKKDKRSGFIVNLKMSLPKFEIKDPSLKLTPEPVVKIVPAQPETKPGARPPENGSPVAPAMAQSGLNPTAPPVESSPAQPASPWEEIMAGQIDAMTRLYAMQKEEEMNDMSHFLNMLNCQAQLMLSQNGSSGGNGGQMPVFSPPAGMQAAPEPAAALPFVGTVTQHEAGRKLVMKHSLNLATDLFLRDHAFIPCPEKVKPAEQKLPTMPMAVALEILAEAAQTLLPGKKVIGLENVSNKRWIGLTESCTEKELVVTATVKADSGAGQIAVACTMAVEGEKDAGLSGTILLADQYPTAGSGLPIAPLPQPGRQFENIDPRLIYRPGGLYHGKSFQGIETILETTDGGVAAHLRVPPTDRFFKDRDGAAMILPAQTIDVASQLICCYDYAMQTKNSWVAPVSIDRIWIYNTPPGPGEQVRARQIIRDNSSNLVRFDVVLESANGVFMVIAGWRDWRMKWSERLLAAWQNPTQKLLARKKKNNTPITKDYYAFYGVNTADLFGMDPDWLARFYLNETEYQQWIKTTGEQQSSALTEWIAIKDATRALLQQKEIFIYPSQIIASRNSSGQFSVRMDDNTINDLTSLSVVTARKDNETVAMAVPVPIEDFSEIKIDLFQ